MKTAILFCVLAVPALWCQETPVPSPGSTDTAVPSAPLPSPQPLAVPDRGIGGAAPVSAKTYKIGAEDVLRVLVWGNAPLSADYIVRPDGKISMPLIGELDAADMTPEQLGSEITTKLKAKYLRNPDVTVGVMSVKSKKFYIQGEVRRPGAFELVVPTTVLEGLSNAGGFQDFADTKHIVIVRGAERLKFNWNEVVKGHRIEQNVYLAPGDHIIVK
jgi:polysaccharide biosynthesis/export protein